MLTTHNISPAPLGRHDGTLPTLDNDGLVPIDIHALIGSRLLATANSGGGKTRLLRRLLEQTFGLVQHIVFDIEGELHTLREQYDYVLVGPNGEAAATIDTAALMATRLLEMGVSVIIDLSELKHGERAEYIKRFLESVMQAHRDLWHEVMIVIDECQVFAPEQGGRPSVALDAVIDLFTRGRKRGFAGVAATQRISELHKSVAAECSSRLIGRTVLDVDQARAAKSLGFTKRDQIAALSNLEPGQFFVLGPAFGKGVQLVQIGDIRTTHARAGARALPPTPPRAKVRAVLAKFSDVAKEAKAEQNELERLRDRVRELETEGASDDRHVLASDAADAARAFEIEIAQLRKDLAAHDGIEDELVQELRQIADRAIAASNLVVNRLEDHVEREPMVIPVRFNPDVKLETYEMNGVSHKEMRELRGDLHGETRTFTPTSGAQDLNKPERAILTALAQRGKLSRAKAMMFAGYRPGGAVTAAFARMIKETWVVASGNGEIEITESGRQALGPFKRLPVGERLRQQILSDRMSTAERAILQAVWDHYPHAISRAAVMDKAGYRPGGAVTEAFAKWIRYGYIVISEKNKVRGAEELFT